MLCCVQRRRKPRDSAAVLSLRLHQTRSSADRAQKQPWAHLLLLLCVKDIKDVTLQNTTFVIITIINVLMHWTFYCCRLFRVSFHPKIKRTKRWNYIIKIIFNIINYIWTWSTNQTYGWIFCEFEIYGSSESWINHISIDVWFGQYL